MLVFVSYFIAVGVLARMRSCAVSNEPVSVIFLFSAPISVHNHLLLVSSADNLCKQFGHRSDPTKRFKRKCYISVQSSSCPFLLVIL